MLKRFALSAQNKTKRLFDKTMSTLKII